ncbi:MAG: 3-hydroxybutyryl-CoA dehydrogenase [Planctomycetes bacterium]|nr:3-hydroxybutyryl-CoA dehydrogenase [Planctomycetota bacterium]
MTHGSHTVTILGSGTMGAGIAQVAVTAGWEVELSDINEATVGAAIAGILKKLNRLVEKGRLTAAQRDDAARRLRVAAWPGSFTECEMVIEAVFEDFQTKVEALAPIVSALPSDAIIASNTSSLSIGRIGEGIGRPGCTVGMHFFNPAPLMKLVEVIAGSDTDPAITDRAVAIAESWGKIVARAADMPGFIVNHVARPYYLEAFRILEEGLAPADAIDAALCDLGGFRMGPLTLTDLIGQDINTVTTRQVFEALGRPPLLAPSPLQEKLAADGHFGRKTGRGVYAYETDAAPPAIEVEPKPLAIGAGLSAAMDDFVARATDATGSDLQRYIFGRILVAIIAQAALAYERGVAPKKDIDTALKHGTNYPKGPFEWAGQIGPQCCGRLLEALNGEVRDNRFAVPGLLKAGA